MDNGGDMVWLNCSRRDPLRVLSIYLGLCRRRPSGFERIWDALVEVVVRSGRCMTRCGPRRMMLDCSVRLSCIRLCP